jgi:hypothetical protein
MHSICIVECRKTMEHNTIEMYTGAVVKRGETVELEPCGESLYTVRERESGVCNFCYSGQESAEYQPSARGRDQIRRAKQVPA